MSSQDTTESRVKEIVAEQLGLAVEDVQLDSSITDDLGADELDKVELIMAIEEEFDCDIDDEDAEGLHTLQDVIDFIGRRPQ